jgi:hypothetical protein
LPFRLQTATADVLKVISWQHRFALLVTSDRAERSAAIF